jgi:hypothetical protein
VPNVPQAPKSFCTNLVIFVGEEAPVDARFSSFGDSANLTQVRRTVCAESTTASEIVLDGPDGTQK